MGFLAKFKRGGGVDFIREANIQPPKSKKKRKNKNRMVKVSRRNNRKK